MQPLLRLVTLYILCVHRPINGYIMMYLRTCIKICISIYILVYALDREIWHCVIYLRCGKFFAWIWRGAVHTESVGVTNASNLQLDKINIIFNLTLLSLCHFSNYYLIPCFAPPPLPTFLKVIMETTWCFFSLFMCCQNDENDRICHGVFPRAANCFARNYAKVFDRKFNCSGRSMFRKMKCMINWTQHLARILYKLVIIISFVSLFARYFCDSLCYYYYYSHRFGSFCRASSLCMYLLDANKDDENGRFFWNCRCECCAEI